MKIVIAGETYAENLGDGVIADTIAFLVRQCDPSASISFLDISGRDSFSQIDAREVTTSHPKLSILSRIKLRLASWLPPSLHNWIRWHLLGEIKRLRHNYSNKLQEADLLLIGGGQLLMDTALQFPLALNLVTKLAGNKKIPYYIVCCGAAKQWSKLGRHLVKGVLQRAQKVVVRDTQSQHNLVQNFNFTKTLIASDPALWSDGCFREYLCPPSARSGLGLGIIATSAINSHRQTSDSKVSDSAMIAAWVGYIAVLHSKYNHIELFTNGHVEDFKLAQKIAHAAFDLRKIRCHVSPRPQVPHQLIAQVSQFEVVVAYRLHACIIATSLSVPIVGIEWDSKVRSFFKDIGRENACISHHEVTGPNILKALAFACATVDNDEAVTQKKLELRQQIKSLVEQHSSQKHSSQGQYRDGIGKAA